MKVSSRKEGSLSTCSWAAVLWIRGQSPGGKARKLLVLPEELSILCTEKKKKKTLGRWSTEGERNRGSKQAAQSRMQLRKAPWRARNFFTAVSRPKPGEYEED